MITLPITYEAITHQPQLINWDPRGQKIQPGITGATREELLPFGDPSDPIRQIERASIRTFVEKHKHLLTGRVLDFGAGKPGTCRQPQPYRDLVTGEYVAYDKGDDWPDGTFDTVLCTQVLQYCEYPGVVILDITKLLRPGGRLILTYATNWAYIETEDLFRFTPAGMMKLLSDYEVLRHEPRAIVRVGSFELPLGFGLVARKP